MKGDFPMFRPEPRSCRGEGAFGIPKEAKRQKSPTKASRPWKNKFSRASDNTQYATLNAQYPLKFEYRTLNIGY
jgi:hypothetical protein